jgi:hypothetical protein
VQNVGRADTVKPSQRRILTINTRHEHEHGDDNRVERNNVPESQLENTSHWHSRKKGYNIETAKRMAYRM